jgi:vancomycin resistance protein VanK
MRRSVIDQQAFSMLTDRTPHRPSAARPADRPVAAPVPRVRVRAERRVLVRPITSGEHAVFARAHGTSFRQTPAWAKMRPGQRAESLGWFTAGELVGAALVLYRPVPGTGRSLAHVPEGPALPWTTVSAEPSRWLDPFVAYLREAGAFAVRIGPTVSVRRWSPDVAAAGTADVTPTEQFADGGPLLDALSASGWRPERPSYRVRLDLFRTLPDLLSATGEQWRHELARSEREGVVVQEGSRDDLLAFHRLHVAAAAWEGSRPQTEDYFRRLMTELSPRLYLARARDGEPLAGVLVVQNGDACWSAHAAGRAPTTAVQWRAITDAHARGCRVYELPGTADLGAGGDLVETAGEWDYSLSPLWYKAFRLYPSRAA